ncbi:MAG: prolipoprotein diacylglyceryl transferase [Micrococcales bacterium]|nr:prolipoprotein diacylglyceryl transferase [Micrococcales bacterium]
MPFLTLIPSPSRGEWHLGPLPLRAYALAVICGIVVAWQIGTRRYADKGGRADVMLDITFWAVPFGILGARLYHLITSPSAYFGRDGEPWRVIALWEGGLGIWGGIGLGAVGALIGARRAGVRLAPILDSVAPALLIAQAIGRLGNWANQELFGRPTTLPWGLQVSAARAKEAGFEPGTLFHPCFAYEILWNLAAAGVLILAERRWRLCRGRLFALYGLAYTLGRVWIEMLRVDDAQVIGGLRLNVWTSLLVAAASIGALIFLARRDDGSPEPLTLVPLSPTTDDDDPHLQDDPDLWEDQAEEDAPPEEDSPPEEDRG